MKHVIVNQHLIKQVAAGWEIDALCCIDDVQVAFLVKQVGVVGNIAADDYAVMLVEADEEGALLCVYSDDYYNTVKRYSSLVDVQVRKAVGDRSKYITL